MWLVYLISHLRKVEILYWLPEAGKSHRVIAVGLVIKHIKCWVTPI